LRRGYHYLPLSSHGVSAPLEDIPLVASAVSGWALPPRGYRSTSRSSQARQRNKLCTGIFHRLTPRFRVMPKRPRTVVHALTRFLGPHSATKPSGQTGPKTGPPSGLPGNHFNQARSRDPTLQSLPSTKVAAPFSAGRPSCDWPYRTVYVVIRSPALWALARRGFASGVFPLLV
jgi:hypothetical protein